MAREINRLTAQGMKGLAEPGRYADGNGLYLSISENGGRRWVFLYRRQGKLREMGLGSAKTVKLAQARTFRDEARDDIAAGLDPIEARDARRANEIGSLIFEKCAEGYIAANRSVKEQCQAWRPVDKYAQAIRLPGHRQAGGIRRNHN